VAVADLALRRAGQARAPAGKLVVWLHGVGLLFVALISPSTRSASSSPRCTWSSTC
jgi:cytochrome c oxidase assembly factor CtaG